MPDIYKIKCPNCKTTFEWREGKVQNKVYLHCNMCGKELLYPEDTESYAPVYPKCECGGWFEKYEYWMPHICPKCGAEIEKHEIRDSCIVESA